MPLPLAPLDPALIHRPKTTAAGAIARRVLGAIGHEAAIQGLTALVLLARFLAWLLFWPAMLLVLACGVGTVIFAANGMWWDVALCVVSGAGAFVLYAGLARFAYR